MNLTSTQVLRQLVDQNINFYLYENARFFAERLFYEDPQSENLFLLAECYFKSGKLKQTCHLLKDCNSMNGRYLYAMASFVLRNFKDAEKALLSVPLDLKTVTRETIESIPGGAAGLYILGSICRQENRRDAAIAYFKWSLQLEPTLWSSASELCDLGVALDTSTLYGVNLDSAQQVLRAGEGQVIGGNGNSSQQFAVPQPSSLVSAPSRSGDMRVVLTHRQQAEQSFEESSFNSTTNFGLHGKGLGGADLGATMGTPSTSISLGLSSMSLRIPFASPGCIPTSAVSSFVSSSPLSTSNGPRHSVEQQTEVEKKEVSGMGRRMLFDMSPSPMMQQGNAWGTHSGEPIPRPSQLPPHHPKPIDPTLSGPSSAMPHTNALSFLHKYQGSGTSVQSSANRRVSFGPTARLSFSSICEDSVGVGVADGEISRTGDLLPGVNLAQSMQSPSGIRRQDFSIGSAYQSQYFDDDESPQKVLRTGQTNVLSSESRTAGPFIHNNSTTPFSMESGVQGLIGGSPSPSMCFSDAPSSRPNADEGRGRGLLFSGSQSGQFSASGEIRGKIGLDDSLAVSPIFGTDTASAPLIGSATVVKNRGRTRARSENDTSNFVEAFPDGRDSGRADEDFNSDNQAGTVSGVRSVVSLMCVFATAYQHLTSYRCIECIHVLHSLPVRHFCSGWVQHLLGRAYYELYEYKPALLALKEMLRLEPFRSKGLGLLSTVLWHLKREKELCALAQQAMEVDKFCPESWCVVGNCFSLQREPDMAIRFFQRALQIDPTFTYAHTLCGHELVNNEDLEKAIMSFRRAIQLDSRHYNAWYGLGSIFFRQEKFDLAEFHFRKAIAINPVSSVLKCYLSMVLHAQNSDEKSAEALSLLEVASASDPRNPQLHFQRAHIMLGSLVAIDEDDQYSEEEKQLVQQEILEDCLKELFVVRELAPREPPVYSMLGDIYSRMGRLEDAVANYNIAISLDPKDAAASKAALDAL